MKLIKSKLWKKTIINSNSTIKDAIENLNSVQLKIVNVVDAQNRFIGTVTDGDIRRGLLNDYNKDFKIKFILNKKPIFIYENTHEEKVLSLMKANKIDKIPVLNKKKQIKGLFLFDMENYKKSLKNYFVIMAGGKGMRLRPITKTIPKAMIIHNGRPMIENLILKAKKEGFRNFIISINYLGTKIKKYLKNGSNLGVSIKYLEEPKPLGTVGSLSMLKNKIDETFVLTNCDIITNTDYSRLLEFHKKNRANITIAAALDYSQNQYGIVKTKKIRVIGLEEKPIEKKQIIAGIYCISPRTLTKLKKNEYYDMPDLLHKAIKDKMKVIAYPIHELWQDIGQTK